MRSIPELSAEANAYDFSPHISFSSWIHACRTLFREASVYYTEGSDPERAYILYLRYADLVLNRLRKHPGFAQNKAPYNKAAAQLPAAIKRSEELKKQLEARPKPAVPQAQTPRRASASRAPNHATDPLELELERYANETTEVPSFDLDSFNVTELAAPVATEVQKRKVPEYQRFLPTTPSSSAYSPAVNSPAAYSPTTPSPTGPSPAISRIASEEPAERIPPAQPVSEIKSIHRTEKGSPLRTIFVPTQLRYEFLSYAASNTRANLETCGILCGKLRHNAFFVTDLVIPHQTSTSDSCTTTNEEELFEYVETRNLFIVGWIHTHPTQTCFMSSVDLHTQASYQIMLPEAVAIVCAPNSSPDWGAFRLTDPPGIGVIKSCKLTGFHQHEPGDNLYKRARPGGHYREIEFNIVVEDLRSK